MSRLTPEDQSLDVQCDTLEMLAEIRDLLKILVSIQTHSIHPSDGAGVLSMLEKFSNKGTQ